MLRKIRNGISGFWYYAWGNLFAIFAYDSQYLSGKYFSGKLGGICSVGWRWVVTDCIARIFLGINRGVPFPISPKMTIVGANHIHFSTDDLNNFQSAGNYYQALMGAEVYIGKGCWIAQNVGLITSNHNMMDPDIHMPGKDIILGEKCWIGMNSVILPGVKLGPSTTVGAGSIVTKSFPAGHCLIAGNPAKKIRDFFPE